MLIAIHQLFYLYLEKKFIMLSAITSNIY